VGCTTTVAMEQACSASAAELPFECWAVDVGWLSGPVGGSVGWPLASFTGGPAGPTDRALLRRSTGWRIMQSAQLSPAYLSKVVELAREHAAWWAHTHSAAARSSNIERAFGVARLQP